MSNRLTTALVLFATAIALAVTLWTSHEQREAAQCQARVNTQFLTTIKARAIIGDGDRASVRTLFEEAVAAGKMKDPVKAKQRSQDAVDAYFQTQKELDELREENPLPNPEQC